ncbi:MAG: phosphatidate cytidylyltransferase [Ruminococcaceae bacterium]|nr:phosphatidate cytidylyltransferase [Oscillospiraceae bacterium]
MKTRVISGVVGALLAVVAVMNYYTLVLDIAAFAIYAIAVSEICRVFRDGNSKLVNLSLILVGTVTLFNSKIGLDPKIIAVVFIAAIVCIVVFDFENIKFTSVASSVMFSLYVLVGVYSIVDIKYVLDFATYGWDAAFLFVLCAGIAWGGDIMAYFSGYLFGKHKMAPKLSPKKTVEGAIGGVAGSVVIAMLMMFVYSKMTMVSSLGILHSFNRNYILLALIAAVGSCLGIIGDLFASAVKRQSGIKDYGTIMPGHGGVMDRFDSFLFVSPVIYLMADFISRL